MKTVSLKELKTEISTLSHPQMLDLCMHLAKYKKENKELLSYLLFEAHDEQSFIEKVKALAIEQFSDINKSNLYLTKKTIRKILRTINKYIKYSGIKQTEVELLIFFCQQFKNASIPVYPNTALGNIYLRQILKINKALASLHEDLQYDYSVEIKDLI